MCSRRRRSVIGIRFDVRYCPNTDVAENGVHRYPAVRESPSMGSIWPEIERALSDARNNARAAMSFASTDLLIDRLATPPW
jgi:hypothetical protein